MIIVVRHMHRLFCPPGEDWEPQIKRDSSGAIVAFSAWPIADNFWDEISGGHFPEVVFPPFGEIFGPVEVYKERVGEDVWKIVMRRPLLDERQDPVT